MASGFIGVRFGLSHVPVFSQPALAAGHPGTLGLDVNRLIRVSFGPFQLLDLAPGAVEAVRRRVLVAQLGPKAAASLGLSESQEERKERHARGKAASGSRDE